MKFDTETEPTIVETECAVFQLRRDSTSGPQPFFWAFRISSATKEMPGGELIGPFVSRDTFNIATAIDGWSPKPQYARCL